MAFNKKTWKNRVSEQPQRRLLTPVDGGESTTVDVTRQEGIVIEEGDAFSAANMNDLENRIKSTFDSDEATLATVNTKANTNANNITSLQTNLTSVSNRVTTNTNNINANKTTETNHYNSLNTKINAVDGRVTTIEGELTANGRRIYMDYKNGRFGVNTSANRGADTFIPFNSASPVHITASKLYHVNKTVTTTCYHTGALSTRYEEVYYPSEDGGGFFGWKAIVTCNTCGDSDSDTRDSQGDAANSATNRLRSHPRTYTIRGDNYWTTDSKESGIVGNITLTY